MKRIALSLLVAAGLAATTARADHVDIRGSINLGGPAYNPPPVYSRGYYAPGYAPARGYWRDVAVNVYVPGQWVVQTEWWGRPTNVWLPAHYEVQTRRIWVGRDRDRDRFEHERWEHRDHDRDRDRDGWRR